MTMWGFTPGMSAGGASIIRSVGSNGRVLQTRMQATIVGGPQLMIALAGLELRIRLVAKEAVGAGCQVIQDEWKARVPVEDGNYRASISTRVGATKTGAGGTIAVRPLDHVVAHTQHPEREQPYLYASRLEFGESGSLRRFGGLRLQHISTPRRAQPSARPAFDRAKGDAVDRVADVLRAAAYVGTL